MNWTNTLGEEWYSIMGKYMESESMGKIVKAITTERQKYTVFPKKNEFYKMFRIFKDLQPSHIKVVILGQDPYPDGSGTGYAFDNNNKLTSAINPSLKNILKEIDENNTQKAFELDTMDLSRWVDQGVFLANTYLTVRKYQPGLHRFWIPFTKRWIKKLSLYDDIIWLLWGANAYRLSEFIENDTHEIIKTSHPSPLALFKSNSTIPAFSGSKCFEKVNNRLWIDQKEPIKW